MPATNPYMQHHYVDPDDISDVTWHWAEVLEARATSLDTAEILVGAVAVADADTVTVHVPSQITGTDVVVRLQFSADTEVTCRALFTNGERRDWTQYIAVKES